MGCQSGAVGVDEGFDLLCFFIAGLNLGEDNQIFKNLKPQNLGKGQVRQNPNRSQHREYVLSLSFFSRPKSHFNIVLLYYTNSNSVNGN